MKALLTSCGLETERVAGQLVQFPPKAPAGCRCLFIPTAAIDADAIEVLPKCLHDVLRCGITKDRVCVHDLHRSMDAQALRPYNAVYV